MVRLGGDAVASAPSGHESVGPHQACGANTRRIMALRRAAPPHGGCGDREGAPGGVHGQHRSDHLTANPQRGVDTDHVASDGGDALEERNARRKPAALGHEPGDMDGHGEDDELTAREWRPGRSSEVPPPGLALGRVVHESQAGELPEAPGHGESDADDEAHTGRPGACCPP